MLYGHNPPAFHEPLSSNRFDIRASINAEKLKKLHQEVQTDLDFINQRTAYYYNERHGKEPKLKKGDKVYLLRKNIDTDRPSDKLDFKKLGPYKILRKKNRLNYQLELPEGSKLFNTFHISLLEPAPKDVRINPNAVQPEVISPEDDTNDNQEWEVQKILDSNYIDGLLYYQVQWKGYPKEEATWEPAENLKGSVRLLRNYHRANPSAPR